MPEKERVELDEKVARLELVMRLAVEKVYMQKAGGKMTLDNLPLAGVLYDESDDPRRSLRWTLNQLRQAIDPAYIVADRQQIGLLSEESY